MTRHNLGQDCHDAYNSWGDGGCRKAPKRSFSNHLLWKDRSCGHYQESSCHVSTCHILSEYIWKPHSGFFKILGLSRKVKRSLTYSAKSSLHLQSKRLQLCERRCNSWHCRLRGHVCPSQAEHIFSIWSSWACIWYLRACIWYLWTCIRKQLTGWTGRSCTSVTGRK